MSHSILRLQSSPFLDDGIETGRKHFSKTLSYTAFGRARVPVTDQYQKCHTAKCLLLSKDRMVVSSIFQV